MNIRELTLVAALLTPLQANWHAQNEQAIARMHSLGARVRAHAALATATRALSVPGRPRLLPRRDPARLVRTILASPRYHLTASQLRSRPKNWLERTWDWAIAQWLRLLRAIFGAARIPSADASAFGYGVLLLLGAGFLILAARAKGAILTNRTRTTQQPRREGTPGADEIFERAAVFAQAGDYARACERLYAAAVAALDARGIAVGDSSATVREFRARLRAKDAGLVPSFDEVARLFTAAAYAQHTVSEAQWHRARDAFITLDRSRPRAA